MALTVGMVEVGVAVVDREGMERASVKRRRVAVARAVRVLRLFRRIGISANVVGSLADGRFSVESDVDFLVSRCPHALKYAIEGRVEDLMGDIPFDVVYREETREKVLRRMESHMADERALLRSVG